MGGVDQLTNGQSQLSMGNCNQICTLNEYLQLSTVLAVYSSKEQEQMPVQNKKSYSLLLQLVPGWGLSAGYQPRPQVVDRGTTARYGGQLRYI